MNFTARGIQCATSAAARLQRHADKARAARRVRSEVMINLIHFAAQPQNDRCRNIRMRQHAGERAAELVRIGADGVTAAFAVREGYHAIDIRRELLIVKTSCDQLGRVRRAVAGRHYSDVIARARSPVFAQISAKRRHVLGRRGVGNLARRVLVFERQFLERHIVRVQVAARLDQTLGAADTLPVPMNHLALLDARDRDLVARWHRVEHFDRHAIDAQLRSNGKRNARDGDIVERVQMYG